MADYSKYLIIEEPLVVLPTIARALDINKAIILQQVQYWVLKSKHERDGFIWIWNSYTEWAEQFPWLTPRAVRHHINGLEEDGLLISGEYNRDKRDNTKWYRIDYQAVDRIVEAATKAAGGVAKSGTPRGKKGRLHVATNGTPLPETTPEITPREEEDSRPVEFLAYEQNIGMLTPVIADAITEAIGEYPDLWIVKAIGIAAENNARSWRYVEKVLENWKAHGINDKVKDNDPDKYVKGKYGHMVNR